jgi:predicted enzyme related to lactoylglutathione lyase
MTEVKHYEPGTPSWVDLASPDVEASAAFNGALFGWTFAAAGPVEETGGYGMFTLRGKNVAGIGPKMNPDQPTGWGLYISVADVEATAARVEAHDGKVLMPPMEVMTAGTMAVFVDSVGASISAWQPRDHIGAEIVNELGSLCWEELRTADTNTAMGFYERVFNWVSTVTEMDGQPYTTFSVGERMVAGMMSDDRSPSHWAIWFAVADCDAAVAKATELGGSVAEPAVDSSVGRFATLVDPHGAQFGVVKLAS